MEQLVGTWEWVESKGYCGTKYPNYCQYSPQSEGFTEAIEFLEKGKFKRYRNGEKVENGRIQFQINEDDLYNVWSFWLYMKTSFKKPEYDWTNSYFLADDTLIFSSYPFDNDVDNYFVRK